jgi:integrase
MLTLAEESGLARDLPTIKLLEENNVRQGKWSEDELKDVLQHAPEYLHALIQMAYYTGWRRGELLSRRWKHVDRKAGFLRIEKYETKGKKARAFPLIPQVLEVLDEQERRRKKIEKRTGRIITALFFHDDGRPIKDFRRAWHRALKDAQCEHRIFHDFRRTAVSAFTAAGIPKQMAKKFSGHVTDSVFDRYDIPDAPALKEFGNKLAEHLEGKAGQDMEVQEEPAASVAG